MTIIISFPLSRYQCGRAMIFENPASKVQYNDSVVVCEWNQTYNYTGFDPCVWTHCINPPTVKTDGKV